jgi:hypothetical protein
MTSAGNAFAPLVGAILSRYFRQNDQPAPSGAEVAAIAARLWALIGERGLPRPLGPAERGAPGEMPDAEVSPLVERVLGDAPPARRAALGGPVRQLVKACFYPEFKACRDSFREVAPDGTCRRQELARARGRVSGAHCVDCPHWVALTPEQHGRYLARTWRPAGAAEFAAHREVFLPEDFRALRRFLHALARAGI